METAMRRRTVFLSIGIATVFLIVSFTSTVSFQTVRSAQTSPMSPLFHRRLENIISQEKTPPFLPMYIGKDKPVRLPLPIREILTEEILAQLSSQEIKHQICLLDNTLLQKWDTILTLVRHNLVEINKIIRQDYSEFQSYLSQYSALSKQDAQQKFLDQLYRLNLHGFEHINAVSTYDTRLGNITAGPFCNITSGTFCQITTQPICQLTTQPICSITKGFFCWTIYGPICPTTGMKCHPPTSRPVLCSIFAAAGKILKTIILVVLLATVIFVPITILSLVLITVLNPQRCEQIHEQITLWLNCTIPQ